VAYDAADQREDAIQAYQRAIELCRTSGFTHLWIVAETGLGIVYERDFALNNAEHSYREVLRLAADPDQPVTCEAHAGLGRIAYARNDLPTAERRFIRGRDLARTIQGIDSHIASDINLCRVYVAAGDRKRAEREMARIKREIRRGSFERQMANLNGLKLRLAFLDRDMETAEALFSASGEGAAGADDFDRLRLQIARGESRAALKELRSMEERAESMGWNDRIITARILQAVATDIVGDRDVARGLLESAWELLQPETAVRPVLDEGETAQALLREIVDPTSHGPRPLAGAGLTQAGEIALSRREREVLTLVAEGLSNEEIGARLFVSLSTVKGHNSRIFEKLGVRRRTEAVAEAKRLGVL
jgi:LuxR family maltose regulon positive regulatory protein